MITYRAALDVPRELAQYLGVCSTLNATDVTTLACDHGISRAADHRYLDEAVTTLAEQAPDLHEVQRQAKDEGLAPRDLRWKDLLRRSPQREDRQRERRADRPVVLRQYP